MRGWVNGYIRLRIRWYHVQHAPSFCRHFIEIRLLYVLRSFKRKGGGGGGGRQMGVREWVSWVFKGLIKKDKNERGMTATVQNNRTVIGTETVTGIGRRVVVCTYQCLQSFSRDVNDVNHIPHRLQHLLTHPFSFRFDRLVLVFPLVADATSVLYH